MITIQLNLLDTETAGRDPEMPALVALVAVHPAAGYPLAVHILTFLYTCDSGHRVTRRNRRECHYNTGAGYNVFIRTGRNKNTPGTRPLAGLARAGRPAPGRSEERRVGEECRS